MHVDVSSPNTNVIRSFKHRGFNDAEIHESPVPFPGFPQLNTPVVSSVVQVLCIAVSIAEIGVVPHTQRFDPSQRGA